MFAEKCPACDGDLRMSSGPGRFKSYKSHTLQLPPDLAFPVCTQCGASWMGTDEVKRLSAFIESKMSRLTDAVCASKASLESTWTFTQAAFGRSVHISVSSIHHVTFAGKAGICSSTSPRDGRMVSMAVRSESDAGKPLTRVA